MGIKAVLHILLIAHGSIPYLFVTLLHVQLLVDHVAPSDAVYTLACVHAQGLQVQVKTCPDRAANHRRLQIVLFPLLGG